VKANIPNNKDGIFIGLMSGTSMDGVDAVAVNFIDNKLHLVSSLINPYPLAIRERLLEITNTSNQFSLEKIATLDILIGKFFASTVEKLLQKTAIVSNDVIAIGSHGQTISHNINKTTPYSWQIGNPANITAQTGITTVANFRSSDVAMGGQGAPLVPAFHEYQFSSDNYHRVIVNVGGIANISILKKSATHLAGYDTGPGNCLMDDWCRINARGNFDKGGEWAKSGNVIQSLLHELLNASYFNQEKTKSTGRELFNLSFLNKVITTKKEWIKAAPEDIQATLLKLTTRSIIKEISKQTLYPPPEIFICGGGASNDFLMRDFKKELPDQKIKDTDCLGIHPDFVEAAAFAWMAKKKIAESPVKLVTGGKHRQLVLGVTYRA